MAGGNEKEGVRGEEVWRETESRAFRTGARKLSL